jgi:hypothetical protein
MKTSISKFLWFDTYEAPWVGKFGFSVLHVNLYFNVCIMYVIFSSIWAVGHILFLIDVQELFHLKSMPFEREDSSYRNRDLPIGLQITKWFSSRWRLQLFWLRFSNSRTPFPTQTAQASSGQRCTGAGSPNVKYNFLETGSTQEAAAAASECTE